MARRRFFVDRVEQGRAIVTGGDAHHLARVLRTEPGQRYEITDGRGGYLAEVAAVGRDRVDFAVLETLPPAGAPLRLIVCASLIKFDRFEWMLEKVTELGAEAIVPVAAARSERGLFEAAAKRAVRWRKIVRESAQQW